MKRLVLLAPLLALLGLAIADRAAAGNYLDSGKTVAHDCAKDPVVNVTGNDNTLTVTGPCTTLNVTGNHNTLTVASVATLNVHGNTNTTTVTAVDTINAYGNQNKVTWTKGVTGKKPTLNNLGTDNKVGPAK